MADVIPDSEIVLFQRDVYRVVGRQLSTSRDIRMGYWVQLGPPHLSSWTDLRRPFASMTQAEMALLKRLADLEKLRRWEGR